MRNTRDCYTVSAMRRDREYQLADLPRGMQSTRENMRALWKRKFGHRRIHLPADHLAQQVRALREHFGENSQRP